MAVSAFYLFPSDSYTFMLVFVQATVDGGSETGELYAAHIALRCDFKAPHYYWTTYLKPDSEHCMPEISQQDAAAFVALKSTDNIPIESSWHLFTNYVGLDIKQIILLGKSLNYFHAGLQLHM